MASTPSASALSAVLRCQGNILARKQASKTRPAASVCGMRKSSHRSYLGALLGYFFHRDNVEFPSVSTQFNTCCLRQSSGRDAAASKKCRQRKLHPDCYIVAFKSERHDLSSQSNLVLRGNDSWKVICGFQRTFCVCVICAQSKSSLKKKAMDSLCPTGLLSLLKNRLVCLTAAVSDIVRTKLGIDWANQIHPDCDKLSGCVKYTTEDHKEALSETRKGEAPEPEE